MIVTGDFMKAVFVYALGILVGVAGVPTAFADPPSEPAIALISKVILDVQRKAAGKDWVVAKRGETLVTGDMVKTGAKSVAIIKFKDNSLVRVRELSELVITGSTTGRAFSKSVDLQKGAVGFNVKKQRTGEEFRFTSPTSVASIRGTEGYYSTGIEGDTLIVLQGKIRFRSKFSSEEIDVEAGYTAIATPDGKILKRLSTQAERDAAEHGFREEPQRNNDLEMEFRDGQGNRKQLKIEFK